MIALDFGSEHLHATPFLVVVSDFFREWHLDCFKRVFEWDCVGGSGLGYVLC